MKNRKQSFDAYARPVIKNPVEPDPFAALRGEVKRLDSWDGSAGTVPDAAACERLESEIWRAARQFREKRNPSLREAVGWLDRLHKSLGVGEVLERCCRKWETLRAGEPLLARLSGRGERGRELLSLMARLESLKPQSLTSYRGELKPDAGESLLAAAWRNRALYAEWRLGFVGRKVFFTGEGARFAGCFDLAMAHMLAGCGLAELPGLDLPGVEKNAWAKVTEREKKRRQRGCQKKSSVT